MTGLTLWNSNRKNFSVKSSFNVESAELAWEKAELAWDSLGYRRQHSHVERHIIQNNVFVKALEGMGNLFKFGRGRDSLNDVNRSNMRMKRGSVHRRLKAVEPDDGTEGETTKDRSLLSINNFPLAASVLVLVGIISLAASLFVSSESRRLNRLAARYEGRNITTMDEEEAEILEFYENKMESGSFQRMLSFDVKDSMEDVEISSVDGPRCSESLERGPLHLRSDEYYTAILQNEGGEGVNNCVDVDECRHEQALCESKSCDDVPSMLDAVDMGESRNSIQDLSQEDFYDCESNCSPQQSLNDSLSSSISSLTTDDIENSSSFSTIDDEDDAAALFTSSIQQSPSINANQTSSPLNSETECTVSATAGTPLIQNICRERTMFMGNMPRSQLERRVSFNPEVQVKEIPRREVNDGYSSERHFYFMLLMVGMLIAVFSFFPAHPSLSPIASMTRKEVLRRADSMLSSQWDVEL